MTIEKFRNMDMIFLIAVAMFTDILLAVFGLLGIRLFLSIAYPLIIIIYIRWNTYGIISNLILMVVHLILYGIIAKVGWPIALLHAVATLGFSSILLMIKLFKQEDRNISTEIYLLMYLVAFMTVFLLEWFLFNVFGYQLNFISHGFNHVLNFMLGLFIIFITSRQRDMLINMKYYLMNKKKEV